MSIKGVKDKKRIVAIDYGIARIGLAISDERKSIASPLVTITTEKKLEMTTDKIVTELLKCRNTHDYDIEQIIVGLPLRMNGKMSLISDEVMQFVAILE